MPKRGDRLGAEGSRPRCLHGCAGKVSSRFPGARKHTAAPEDATGVSGGRERPACLRRRARISHQQRRARGTAAGSHSLGRVLRRHGHKTVARSASPPGSALDRQACRHRGATHRPSWLGPSVFHRAVGLGSTAPPWLVPGRHRHHRISYATPIATSALYSVGTSIRIHSRTITSTTACSTAETILSHPATGSFVTVEKSGTMNTFMTPAMEKRRSPRG